MTVAKKRRPYHAPRRAEQASATRQAIISAASELFAERGYAAVSVEEIVRRARVTRGALYHHFEDKADLFRAVFENVQQDLARRLLDAAASQPDASKHLEIGCHAFLEACAEPDVQRIVLLDGPAVLGWERLREIEASYGMLLLRQGLQEAIDAGRLGRHDVDSLAMLLNGALCEGAMYVARAPDQTAAMKKVEREIKHLVEGLAR